MGSNQPDADSNGSRFPGAAEMLPFSSAQHRLLNRVADWVDAGRVKSTMRHRLSPINAENLRRAHAMLETGRTIGKVVVEGWG